MKILNIAGARPNFMKIAPLMRAMAQQPDLDAHIVHTGQHYDESMSRIFFHELGIPHPKVNLEVGSGSRPEQIERIMTKFEPVMATEQPDAVLVVGDVNSTIACARIAKEHECPVVHVEAGLRSFDREMPEEVNRVETDQIADYLFVTEQSGMDNLASEKIAGKSFLVGNVMIDTLVQHLETSRAEGFHDNYGLTTGEYFVATFHRPSNVDAESPLTNIVSIIEYAAEQYPIVLPLHPRTKQSLARHGLLDRILGNRGVHVARTVESGDEILDREMPEEVNRVETDQIADYLFVTEQSGMDNLASEKIAGKSFLVGNVMIDTLVQHLETSRAEGFHDNYGLTTGEYFVATFHRPSNVDAESPLTNIVSIIEYAAEQYPIVLPLHPRTKQSLARHGLLDRILGNRGVRVIDPLGYLDFIALVSQAACVVTDSGGIQEETTYLQVPCVTMRDNTERPVTVDVGSNILAGTEPDRVIAAMDSVLTGNAGKGSIPDFWDGFAAERIVEILAAELAE